MKKAAAAALILVIFFFYSCGNGNNGGDNGFFGTQERLKMLASMQSFQQIGGGWGLNSIVQSRIQTRIAVLDYLIRNDIRPLTEDEIGWVRRTFAQNCAYIREKEKEKNIANESDPLWIFFGYFTAREMFDRLTFYHNILVELGENADLDMFLDVLLAIAGDYRKNAWLSNFQADADIICILSEYLKDERYSARRYDITKTLRALLDYSVSLGSELLETGDLDRLSAECATPSLTKLWVSDGFARIYYSLVRDGKDIGFGSYAGILGEMISKGVSDDIRKSFNDVYFGPGHANDKEFADFSGKVAIMTGQSVVQYIAPTCLIRWYTTEMKPGGNDLLKEMAKCLISMRFLDGGWGCALTTFKSIEVLKELSGSVPAVWLNGRKYSLSADIDNARRWLEACQKRDGFWPTGLRNNYMEEKTIYETLNMIYLSQGIQTSSNRKNIDKAVKLIGETIFEKKWKECVDDIGQIAGSDLGGYTASEYVVLSAGKRLGLFFSDVTEVFASSLKYEGNYESGQYLDKILYGKFGVANWSYSRDSGMWQTSESSAFEPDIAVSRYALKVIIEAAKAVKIHPDLREKAERALNALKEKGKAEMLVFLGRAPDISTGVASGPESLYEAIETLYVLNAGYEAKLTGDDGLLSNYLGMLVKKNPVDTLMIELQRIDEKTDMGGKSVIYDNVLIHAVELYLMTKKHPEFDETTRRLKDIFGALIDEGKAEYYPRIGWEIRRDTFGGIPLYGLVKP